MMIAPEQDRSSQKGVKEPTIPVDVEDFKSDPAVYDAIQKQLGTQSQSEPTPQSQPGMSPQGASTTLQSTATDLQAR